MIQHDQLLNMSLKSFCISWKDFPSHLGSTFQDLIAERHFADVTLVSDDQKQIQAHRIVLSASSHVLKNILVNNPHSHPLIFLKGIKHQELHSILQFMYLGEASINQDSINKFMENARDLEVKDLVHDVNYESESKLTTPENITIDTSETTQEDEQIGVTDVKYEEKELEYYEQQIQDFSLDENLLNDSRSTDQSKMYSCDKCEYQANHRQLMKRHKLNKHEGVSFPCDECDIKYTDITGLRKHLLSKHEGIRHECDRCDYSATRKDTLRNHKISIHDDGLKYSCNQCDYQGTTQKLVMKHKQVKHEGPKHSCN